MELYVLVLIWLVYISAAAAASIWALTKFSYSSFGGSVSDIFCSESNLFLSVIVYLSLVSLLLSRDQSLCVVLVVRVVFLRRLKSIFAVTMWWFKKNFPLYFLFLFFIFFPCFFICLFFPSFYSSLYSFNFNLDSSYLLFRFLFRPCWLLLVFDIWLVYYILWRGIKYLSQDGSLFFARVKTRQPGTWSLAK